MQIYSIQINLRKWHIDLNDGYLSRLDAKDSLIYANQLQALKAEDNRLDFCQKSLEQLKYAYNRKEMSQKVIKFYSS